jgi:hypothetical protein
VSRKKNTKAHRWTVEDDELLFEVLEGSLIKNIKDLYKRQNHKANKSHFWDSVAAILVANGGPLVTGSACNRRVYKFTKQKEKREFAWESSIPPDCFSEEERYQTELESLLFEIWELGTSLSPDRTIIPLQDTLEAWVAKMATSEGISLQSVLLGKLEDVRQQLFNMEASHSG